MEEQLMIDILYWSVLCAIVFGLVLSYFKAHKKNWEKYQDEAIEEAAEELDKEIPKRLRKGVDMRKKKVGLARASKRTRQRVARKGGKASARKRRKSFSKRTVRNFWR